MKFIALYRRYVSPGALRGQRGRHALPAVLSICQRACCGNDTPVAGYTDPAGYRSREISFITGPYFHGAHMRMGNLEEIGGLVLKCNHVFFEPGVFIYVYLHLHVHVLYIRLIYIYIHIICLYILQFSTCIYFSFISY